MCEKPKGGREKKCKGCRGWDFFIFIFSLLAIMMTDTTCRKSSLGNLFFKKVVLGISNHCTYHTDLLVFCLKFRLSPVCEYLNYYYNIINDYWTIPEKSKQEGLRTYFFEKKNRDFLCLSRYPWNFWTKRSFTLGNFVKLLHLLETPRPNTKTCGN